MFRQDPCGSDLPPGEVSGNGWRPSFVQDTARQNRLLAALSPADYKRLRPHLSPVPLPLGWTVYGPGDAQRFLYFLTSGIVSRIGVTGSGESTEVAVTGNEGVIGIAAFLGGESTTSTAVVTSPGFAFRLEVSPPHGRLQHGSQLASLLLRYTQALIVQTGQLAVCNRCHSMEQRLCVWILSCIDRLPSNELAMTQETVAHMLGVRREGITHALGTLQDAGLICWSRGHVLVLDRARLEARACECYAVIKGEYDRLLPGNGPTSDAADVHLMAMDPRFPRTGNARP
jgi:CRP-like cAMP-binding protein